MAGLSYLDVQRLPGGMFMGGILTVNELGLPTEFIYSDPVVPDQLQVNLYGSTLGRYVMVDVVGKGLVDASQARGVPVVVGHGDLLALATRIKRPLCYLMQSNQRPLGEVGAIRESSREEFLAQLAEVQSPWLFRIYDRANFSLESQLSAFTECAGRFDLLEPLQRVKRTLELIKDDSAK
jgi:hypothetical protein